MTATHGNIFSFRNGRIGARSNGSGANSTPAGRVHSPPDRISNSDIAATTPKTILNAMERAAPMFLGRNASTDIADIRKTISRAAKFQPNPYGVRHRRGLVGGVPGEWIEPRTDTSSTVLLYLHGGGYVSGSPATHRLLVGSLARRARFRAFVPDYRLAPEHPPPAQLEDALVTYSRIVAVHGPENVVVAGDSAGGGLAVMLCCALRDGGLPLPRRMALLSPWVDLAGPGPEDIASRAGTDIVMCPEQISAVAEVLAPGDRSNPAISPINADLSGLPPTLIQVGLAELIGAQGERLAARMTAAGVDVVLERWERMQHVFQTVFILPERRMALDHLSDFLTAYDGSRSEESSG